MNYASDDIVLKIMDMYLRDGPAGLQYDVYDQSRAPQWTLALVCRHWHGLVLRSPAFWTDINVDFGMVRNRPSVMMGDKRDFFAPLLDRSMALACDMPLSVSVSYSPIGVHSDVCITTQDDQIAAAFPDALSNYQGRIRRFGLHDLPFRRAKVLIEGLCYGQKRSLLENTLEELHICPQASSSFLGFGTDNISELFAPFAACTQIYALIVGAPRHNLRLNEPHLNGRAVPAFPWGRLRYMQLDEAVSSNLVMKMLHAAGSNLEVLVLRKNGLSPMSLLGDYPRVNSTPHMHNQPVVLSGLRVFRAYNFRARAHIDIYPLLRCPSLQRIEADCLNREMRNLLITPMTVRQRRFGVVSIGPQEDIAALISRSRPPLQEVRILLDVHTVVVLSSRDAGNRIDIRLHPHYLDFLQTSPLVPCVVFSTPDVLPEVTVIVAESLGELCVFPMALLEFVAAHWEKMKSFVLVTEETTLPLSAHELKRYQRSELSRMLDSYRDNGLDVRVVQRRAMGE